MKKIKLLSLFSGIGAFEKALDKLNIKYELVNYCEIDKYASKAYSLIHNVSENMNLGDITKVDTSKLPNDIDLVTYGFPCQDIALLGKLKGMFNKDGSKTRSGLFFEALRIIEDTKPKIAIAENVKNLVGKKFKNQFEIVLKSLEEAGYNTYWKVLNAKDYGIPQNRERVFIVSIRKDIDNGTFKFPEPIELKLRIKDMLEDNVDEKYFLSKAMKDYLTENSRKNKDTNFNRKKVFKRCFQNTNKNGIAVTITTAAGQRSTDNFVLDPFIMNVEINDIINNIDNSRIRKLTPKECFRLMGFEDKDVDYLIKNGVSNTRLYKMAGNSIVVDVLYYILKNLYLNN